MALTRIEAQGIKPSTRPNTMEEPPAVLITPCDPWPRPFYFQDGLRRVAPYHFTYNTWCKQRWRGREILEIFADEFRDRPVEYYANAVEKGAVLVNGKPVASARHIVKNGDLVSHTLHRHEPPVTAQEIGIVHEDEDMIVINKPAGIPVHPSGRYNYNSVTEVMRAERGQDFNPMPCNRLDRLTSGVMFIAKHRKAAEELGEQIMDRTVKKEYVARVRGEFPEGEIVCEQPIMQISPKLGLNRVRADGKDARTVFKRLAYYPPQACSDGGEEAAETKVTPGMAWKQKEGYSIVRCRPLTGRTHQLRVHLQYLGHPISNDPIYANQRVWGINLGKGESQADNDEDIMSRLCRMGKSEVADAVAYHDEMLQRYNKTKGEKLTGKNCELCGTELYSDPSPHELGIYLHARKYAAGDGRWSYETELPEWALPPSGYAGPVDLGDESDPLAVDLAKLGIAGEGAEVK
jgi:tRNA pseudouridine synthase 9